MVPWVALGLVIGILGAYLATRKKKDFRRHLQNDLERHLRDGTAWDYVTWVIEHRKQWEKAFTLIRKPFGNEVNLIIETAAFLLALLGLVTSLANFDRSFDSVTQGVAVTVFLGAILAFIPSERFFTARIDSEIDGVLTELRDAAKKRKLEDYIKRS